MRVAGTVPRLTARRAGGALATSLFVLVALVSLAYADETVAVRPAVAASTSRLSPADPLNGGYLLVNMHGMLFHRLDSDIQEDVAYARWLGSGVIRVFATDNNSLQPWDGRRVGSRIAEVAPMLRAAHVQLLVALVNNHRAVPGEVSASAGWMENYWQLLLPFYTSNWRGAYLQFVRDLVSTVHARGAQDVIFAWELGNELHTPQQPAALIPFVTDAVEQLRALDQTTPILAGTMGANHVEPREPRSTIARWLYCDAPIDAYTLHAYDWVDRQRPGDMPIDWDLDNIVSEPCPNGRNLPVIVEELGTSRSLPGVYTAEDGLGRLAQELRQIEFVRRFPQVVGFGVWNGESPLLEDRTFVDTRRGLTSYGSDGRGGGSCYDPWPDPAPGVRCELEQALRRLRFVRVGSFIQWTPGPDADTTRDLVGRVDPVYKEDFGDLLSISGWVLDSSAGESAGIVDRVDAFLGSAGGSGIRLASARLGLPREDVPSGLANADGTPAGFALSLPLVRLPIGLTTLTLAARTPEHGTWLSTVQVVVPNLGPAPAVRRARSLAPVAVPTVQIITPPVGVEIQVPRPGDLVARTFMLQVLAPGADRVDVFLDPGRDRGGHLVGSASTRQLSTTPFQVRVNAPRGSQTLHVHAYSTTSGPETVLSLPVVVS
jgi:hypothetical protein